MADASMEVERFLSEREELNRLLLEKADRVVKRFFSLDSVACSDRALPARTKELLGGSITIPHARRAVRYWRGLPAEATEEGGENA